MAIVKRQLQPGERIRIMVVDDSVVIRRLITHALEYDPELEIVGTAANGALGLQRIPHLDPDIVTLDIEMPGMDGLEMLRCIRRDYPHLRVIMFSTLTERGAAITLEALTLGADDYVSKVNNGGSLDGAVHRLRAEMIPKIKQFFLSSKHAGVQPLQEDTHALGIAQPIVSKMQPQAVVIGISTGGPAALGLVLPMLPADFPLPILIVQHMPPLFTRLLADRLNNSCMMKVEEARHGDLVERGKILLAPGDFHMRLNSSSGSVRVSLDQEPQQNFCRPAVDILFKSASEVYGGAVLAVILTGMGHDGLRGVEVLKARGARVIAQDELSSVVWGMPGAVVNAGLADGVFPLDGVASEILRVTRRN